jgi:hypothetical protein
MSADDKRLPAASEDSKELVGFGKPGDQNPEPLGVSPDGRSKRKEIRRRKRVKPTGTLSERVKAFVDSLETDFPERFKHRSKDMKKRVLQLVKFHMPPHPKRPGKRKTSWMSEAHRMWQHQRREISEGKRMKVDWLSLAKEWIPDFEKIRSNLVRSAKIRKLRNAVAQRVARQGQERLQRNRAGGKRAPVRGQVLSLDSPCE